MSSLPNFAQNKPGGKLPNIPLNACEKTFAFTKALT
jgi:hypothetical protein